MAHQRKVIREAVKTMLDGNVTYGGNPVTVYQSRVVPYFNVELPALAIYFLNETADDRESAPREYKRYMELVVQIVVAEIKDVITDDIIDDIAYQIEQIFFKDSWLLDTCCDSLYKSTNITFKENGDRIFTAAALVFEIEYDTYAPDTQPLDDLLTENTRTDTQGQTEQDAAADQTIDSETNLQP